MLSRALSIAALLIVSSALLACGDGPSTADCQKLMDHLISIEMDSGGAGALSPELEADRDAAKKRVLGYLEEDFMKSCEKQLSKGRVECGMKAKNPAELAACDEE